MYYTKIVLPPGQLAETNLRRFENKFLDLLKAFDDFSVAMDNIASLTHELQQGPWLSASSAVLEAMRYLDDRDIRKKNIAETVTSQAAQDSIAGLKLFLKDQRNALTTATEMWESLERAYIDVYIDMIKESTTLDFYRKIHDDVTTIVTNGTDRDYLIGVLAQMLDKSQDDLVNATARDWNLLVNSDFAVVDLNMTMSNLTSVFEDQQGFEGVRTVERNVEGFIEALQLMQKDMQGYLSQLTLDSNFFE